MSFCHDLATIGSEDGKATVQVGPLSSDTGQAEEMRPGPVGGPTLHSSTCIYGMQADMQVPSHNHQITWRSQAAATKLGTGNWSEVLGCCVNMACCL